MPHLPLHGSQRHRKGRNRRQLSLEDCWLMRLEYWREYRMQFHIAHSYGVDEATVIFRTASQSVCDGFF